MKNKTRLFFDLDNTLTPSRQIIRPEMEELLFSLPHTIVIVSGSKYQQICRQMDRHDFYALGQNGNQSFDPASTLLWENNLNKDEKDEIDAHIEELKPHIKHYLPDWNDLYEDRGSQISWSIYGHNADPEAKKACDGDFAKRKKLLQACPFDSERLEVQLGGSTCLDYFKKGFNKGRNVNTLIERLGWSKDECVYFGDALFPGGNDAAVMGVIDTVAVTDERDTYAKLKQLA